MAKLFLGRHNTHPYSLQGGNPMIDQSMATPEVQFGEPIFYWGYRNMGKGLHIGTEMTWRQLHLQSPTYHGL